MDLQRIPYTWTRHFVLGLVAAAVALWVWLGVQTIVVVSAVDLHLSGIYWKTEVEGPLFLATTAGALAATSVFLEWSLRGRTRFWRMFYASGAFLSAFLFVILGSVIYTFAIRGYGGEDWGSTYADPSLTSLRYRALLWALAGMGSGFGAWMARATRFFQEKLGFSDGRGSPVQATWSSLLSDGYHHLVGGMAGGLLAGAVEFAGFGYPLLGGDLYVGSAVAVMVWGFVHGCLCWVIPDDMYVGWIRVLTPERFGRRIPIADVQAVPSERFVGHYPRGLDLYLPAERGVTELHASFVHDGAGKYTIRGLTRKPTTVHRFLETIDLSYDADRPAPLETRLRMEDRLRFGPKGETEVEFLMLPKEER